MGKLDFGLIRWTGLCVAGTRYMVVDCGGGTVDITVHEMENEASGNLRELYKAAGGPYGSTGLLSCLVSLLKNVILY